MSQSEAAGRVAAKSSIPAPRGDLHKHPKNAHTTAYSKGGQQNLACKRMLKSGDYSMVGLFKESVALMAIKIRHILSIGLIIATGAILGVAATALLITGIVIEYKIYSKPGWPFGDTTQKRRKLN